MPGYWNSWSKHILDDNGDNKNQRLNSSHYMHSSILKTPSSTQRPSKKVLRWPVSMAIPVVEFSRGGYENRKKMPKNQHTQRNFLNFGYCTNGSGQKVPKFDFQSQFCMSKIIWIFMFFFSLKNTNLEAHFLLLKFFDNVNLWIFFF